ncbi:MAG: HAD-IC family P-type ATPase, partial [Anaerolineae bacterium]|nr:HAD-IC family P-type ATPase [Anaerolineae bacterium]
TLTANKINYHDVYPVDIEPAQLQPVLGSFARSASATNKTSEALIAGLAGEKHDPVDEVPFSSALKWSALAFDDEKMRGVYVLGALAMLRDHLEVSADVVAQIEQWSDEGLRVLVFAHNPEVLILHNAAGKPELPTLTLLGVISLSDELRPHLKETVAGFSANGIALKVISGDNPQTVAALARQAGFAGDLKYVSGTDLAEMDDVEFAQVAAEATVFGRITPDQKERLVDTLQQQGHYVAMIGDGVNDVLSLKKANLGIAMESGSAATRGVADMILIGDSFNALPAAFSEGQRIVNGMKDILRLFLTRVAYAAILIIAIDLIGLGFPFIPKQNSLLVGIGVGLPTLGLAVWARPGTMPKRGLLREIGRFVVPAALSISFFGVLVYSLAFSVGIINVLGTNTTPDTIASFEEYVGIDYTLTTASAYQVEVAHLVAQTALTTFTVFASLILVVFVEPPIQYFVAGDEFSGDWRPTLLAVGLFVVYMVIVLVEPLRTFFEMIDLPILAYVAIAAIALIWMLLLRMAWRHNWLERFLQVERLGD